MAAALTPTLAKNDFQNWIKGAMAVLFAKEGIEDFVEQEIADFQRDLLRTVYTQSGIPTSTTCNICTTANVLACPSEGFCSKGKKCKAHNPKGPDKIPNKACPNGLCTVTAIRDGIRNEHRFHDPSWKNTDTRRWCSDAYEISKCFMPKDGYSGKNCLAETDFNGVLAIVINSKRFRTKLSVNLCVEPNICTEARIIGREIRHSANHLLSEQDLMKYIDDLIILRSDPAYLAKDVNAKNAVEKLKQLKTSTLMIHTEDITNVLNDSIKATFDEHQQAFILDLQNHFKAYETDSVEAIDKKMQEFVILENNNLRELKAQTITGIDELTAQSKRGKEELTAQTESGKEKLTAQTERGKEELTAQTERGKKELTAQTERGEEKLTAQTERGNEDLTAQTESGKKELTAQTERGKEELTAQTERGKEELTAQTERGKNELTSQTERGKKSSLHKLKEERRSSLHKLK